MKAQIIEISGYAGAFMSLYMTGKNVDSKRLDHIQATIEGATNRWGFFDKPESVHGKDFIEYMDKVIKYGIKHEHETILDFIKVTIFMEDLHRGAQDDYDAHAKRLDIIRSSTRANKKSSGSAAELSDWYKDKVLPFGALTSDMIGDRVEGSLEFAYLPDMFVDTNGIKWVKTPWGYVKEELAKDADVLRGLVPLGVVCDNVSTISYRNLRHVYHMRRRGTHAAPELQDVIEMTREDLCVKCAPLGYCLGRVWVPGANEYIERPNTVIALKDEEW